MPPLLEFTGITKRFNDTTILDNIDLEVFQGETLALVGKSGAGKTTLLRLLMGFYKPDIGTVQYQEKDITHDLERMRRIVGVCTQDNSFYPRLSVYENLQFYANMYDVEPHLIDDRIHRLLEIVELTDSTHTIASTLSGGMMRRLDFAISLVHNPLILIMDEPTTGLDPILRKHLWSVVLRAHKMGKTIIFTTHILDEVEQYATRGAILSDGKIISIASMDQYKEHYNMSFPQIYEEIMNNEQNTTTGH